jgi:hypothetical protein
MVTDQQFSVHLTASDGVNANYTEVRIIFLQELGTRIGNPEPESTEEVINIKIIAIVSGVGSFLLIGAILAALFYKRRTRKQQKDINRLTEAEIREFREGASNLPVTRDSVSINVPVLSRPYNTQFEIPRGDLKIGKGLLSYHYYIHWFQRFKL